MEFALQDQQYRTSGKLDAFKQLHVVRRLAPLLGSLDSAREADVFQALAVAMAGMADADVDFVLFACLALVQRKQGDSWVAVFMPATKLMQFDDIDMACMMQMIIRVLQENLASFFSGGGVAKIMETVTTPA